MPWADLALGLLLATACVRGLFRGLLGEAVSLLGVGLVALAVIHGTQPAAEALARRIGLPEAIGMVAGAILLAGVTGLGCYLIRRWIHRRWKGLRRALPNRLGGGLAATAKCVVLLSALLVLGGPRLPGKFRAGLDRSVIAPRIAPVAPWLYARGVPLIPASTRARAAALGVRLGAAWGRPRPDAGAAPKPRDLTPNITPPVPRRA